MRATLCAILIVGTLAGAVLADDHGDSPLTATPVEVDGNLLAACIEAPEDMDYFLFTGIAGRSYRILATHESAAMDSVLYLFASDGQTILAVAHAQEDRSSARIDWTAPEDGTYFVMVRHGQSATGTGCYALSVSLELLDDHGDDRLSASPLSVNAAPTPGFIETSDDVDAFFFPVERGYDYVVTLTRTSNQGALLLDVVGDPAAEQRVELDEAARIDVSVQEAGSLFLLVRAAAETRAVGYEISARRAGYADDYGNDAATAFPLDPHGPTLSGAIEVPSDADWFRLEARADGEYALTLSTSAGLSCRLTLRTADGNVTLEAIATVAGASASTAWTAPESATYFVEIVGTAGTGAYSLDIMSTLQLEAIGRFNPSGYSLDVWARDSLVYLIVGVKGLSIVDVSDPTDPREIGSHSTRGYAEAIALAGSFALVANRGDGLTVLDVSDPTRPVEVGALETPGWAQDVAVEGIRAVIADQRAGIHVVEIASSGDVDLLSSYETLGHAGAVAFVDDIVYVAIGDAGLEIVDLSNPESPAFLGAVEVSGDARDVVVRGSIAYVASGYRGVRIVDVSDPASAREVGWFGSSDEAVGLHLSGNHLFVAERTGLSVYSLSDPLAPQRVAEIDTPGEAIAVFVTDGLVFIADRQEGLQIARLLP